MAPEAKVAKGILCKHSCDRRLYGAITRIVGTRSVGADIPPARSLPVYWPTPAWAAEFGCAATGGAFSTATISVSPGIRTVVAVTSLDGSIV